MCNYETLHDAAECTIIGGRVWKTCKRNLRREWQYILRVTAVEGRVVRSFTFFSSVQSRSASFFPFNDSAR